MPPQDILDDPASAYPQLHQFLGGYFHQDWAEDGDAWQPVVDDFSAESPGSVVVDTAAELRALLGAGFADIDLAVMLERLGGSVVPSAFGMTATSWLGAVLQRLSSSG
jgi:hypothetical protein